MSLTDLYFAYGADMDLATLRTRAGGAEAGATARLAGFRIAFFGHDQVWDGGMETLVADAAMETWGVLYRLRTAEWERLDNCMGATLEGSGAYFHYPVDVITSAGESYQVRTYRKSTMGKPRAPSDEYLAFLCTAASCHNFPAAYQAALRAVPSVPASSPVPKKGPGQQRHLHLPWI